MLLTILIRVYAKMSNTKMSNRLTFFPFFVIEEKMSNRNFEKSTFFPFCSTFFHFSGIKLKCRIKILHKLTFCPFVRHFFLLVQNFFLFLLLRKNVERYEMTLKSSSATKTLDIFLVSIDTLY